MYRVMLWATLLTAVGCEVETDETSSGSDQGAVTLDGGGGSLDGATPDAAVDAGARSCVEQVTLNETFAVAPGLGQTQIHGDAALVGDSLWITFNREEDDGAKFDVWATQIGCDGAVRTAPFRVNTEIGFNDTDPVVAATGSRLLIAWSRDSGGEQPNLSLRYRLYDLAGEPLGGERVLVTELDGAPLVANHWLPAITRLADGFAIAGARGIEGMGFQTFVQRLDRDGDPFGEAVAQAGEYGQVNPEIAADSEGRMYVAWTEQRDVDTVVHTQLAPAGAAFDPAPEGVFQGTSASVKLDAEAGLWLAASVDPGGGPKAGLIRGGKFGVDQDPLLFGAGGRVDHSPTVAGDPDGGWIGWYRVIRGFSSEVWVSRFSVSAEAPQAVGEPVQIETESPAAPYALVLKHVGDGVAFVAWSEGMSPNFTLQARFIRHE